MPTEADPLYKLRRDLAASVATKRTLYLDLLYWNHLCDAAIGRTESPDHESLLADLRTAVHGGAVLCPAELTTFVELYKQRLPEKRRVTAEIIDELSGGVVIISPPERCLLEALRMIQAILAQAPLPSAPRDEIWTKAAYFIGHGELKAPKMAPSDLDRLNSLMRDKLWDMGFAELMDRLGPDFITSFETLERTAQQLNSAKPEARSEFTSFRQTYLAEVRGILDASAGSLGDAMRYLFDRAGEDAERVSDEQRDESGKQFAQLLGAAFANAGLLEAAPVNPCPRNAIRERAVGYTAAVQSERHSRFQSRFSSTRLL